MTVESVVMDQRSQGAWNPEHDGLLAVVAHGLLGSVAVVSGAVSMLVEHPELDAAERADLLDLAGRQATLMAGVLQDLMRGVPPDVVDALNRIGPAHAA